MAWIRHGSVISVLAALLVFGGASGAPGPSPRSGADPETDDPAPAADRVSALRDELIGLLQGAGRWRSARWSVLAVSLDHGDTLFAENPGDRLAPASNMKLITTAAALHYLGPDFRYQTFLLTDGSVAGGRLTGDLILYGTGDPGISDRFQSTTTAVFESFADSLLAADIHVVEGDVIGDGSYFTGPLLGEGWNPQDLNDWFTAPSSGLALGENVFTLRVDPTAVAEGGRPAVHTLPDAAGVPMSVVAQIGSGGGLRIRRDHPGQPIVIEGSIAPGSREVWRQMTVQDPDHFAASVLHRVLEKKGIRVTGGVRATAGAAASPVTGRKVWAPAMGDRPVLRVLARHVSPRLQEYLEVVNKRSHNLLAEQVLKTVGRVGVGEGSFEGGARALRRFLAEPVGLDTTDMAIHDGSGLSTLNRTSAADFIALMDHMARSERWTSFWESLPEAGNPRELRRMYRTAAAGNLRAKTGTIENVSALSGVVRSAGGERIAFSIIANQVPSTGAAKRIEDRIGSSLASFDRPFPPSGPGDPTRLASVKDFADPGSGTLSSEAEATGEDGSATGGTAGGAGSPGAASHTVRSGENLSVIARRHGVSVNALAEANPGLSPKSLMPGTELVIPKREGGVAPAERQDPKRHQVRSGENLTMIARTYGVSLNDLLAANPSISPRRLQVGQWLEIPGPTEPNR